MNYYQIDNITLYDGVTCIPGVPLPHTIEKVVTVVCVSGSINVGLDSRQFTMHQGQMMVLTPNTLILACEPDNDFLGYSIVTPMNRLNPSVTSVPQLMRCFMHFRGNPLVMLTDEELETQLQLRSILKRRLDERITDSRPTPFFDNIVQALLHSLFYEILSIYTRRMEQTAIIDEDSSRRAEIFKEFTTAVSRDFRVERTVSHYASKLCISPKHLSNVVKDLSGLSPLQWINTYVMLEAKKLLDTTDLTIQQIATNLNFPNQSFFGKFFKKHAGHSPRAYRNPNR